MAKMEFKKRQLDNGLTIIGEVNPAAKSAAVGFFVKTGSRDESLNINGVSHFLEHMVFKGTDKINSFQVNEAFDRTGAQFNAFTSEENTVYYAAVLPEYLQEVTDLWMELMRPALREEDFNIEKNVIKEEIAMYQDHPTFDVMDRCRNLHFENHPCGNSVLGSVESIDAMTAEQMRGYFTSRYAPNNMAAVICGNFDWDKISSQIASHCGKWKDSVTAREISDYTGSGKKVKLEKGNLTSEHICLMSPAVSYQDKRRFASLVLASIVGDEQGSRFFWELVDKAIAETASMQYYPMDGTGAYFTYIRCNRENSQKALEIVNSIFTSLASSGITEQELRKAKNKILSAVVIKNEIPMGRLVDLGFNWNYLQLYHSISEDVEAIKTVSADDINGLIKKLPMCGFTQYSLVPAQK